MALAETDKIILTYLKAQSGLTALLTDADEGIYIPRLPEGADLPAISMFSQGGAAQPYIPDFVMPDIQFLCWASDLIVARQVYRKLYDVLHAIANVTVTYDGKNFKIHSAIEEVQGQDLQDVTVTDYFSVMTSYRFTISASE